MLRGELAAFAVGDEPAFGDTKERVMRLVILTGGEKRLFGRDESDAPRIGEFDQRRLGHPLRLHPVPLQFDVQPVAEQALQTLRSATAPTRFVRRRSQRSSGPPGPPESAIKPSASAASHASLMCGGSVGADSR
jgi:hypothetical protein